MGGCRSMNQMEGEMDDWDGNIIVKREWSGKEEVKMRGDGRNRN